MIAKFSRPCVHCGVAIKPGKDIYDVATKRSYHEACETAAAGPAPDAAGLADQLGYVEHERAFHCEWSTLRFLPGRTGSATTGRVEPEAPVGQSALWPMSASVEEQG